MNIGWAVEAMQEGMLVRRAGWNGKGMWLQLSSPATRTIQGRGVGGVIMTLPFVYMYTAQGEYVPWLCSQTDLLADDWEKAETGHEFTVKETGTPEHRNIWVGETRLCLIKHDEGRWRIVGAGVRDMKQLGYAGLGEVSRAISSLLSTLPPPEIDDWEKAP